MNKTINYSLHDNNNTGEIMNIVMTAFPTAPSEVLRKMTSTIRDLMYEVSFEIKFDKDGNLISLRRKLSGE